MNPIWKKLTQCKLNPIWNDPSLKDLVQNVAYSEWRFKPLITYLLWKLECDRNEFKRNSETSWTFVNLNNYATLLVPWFLNLSNAEGEQ